MKSLLHIRVAFCALFLALTINGIAAFIQHDKKAGIENCSASLLIGGFTAPMLKHSENTLDRKSFYKNRKSIFAGTTIVTDDSGTTNGGKIMRRDPATAGARASNAEGLSGGTTTVRKLVPENTMKGLLTFTLTADSVTYNGTDPIPFLPSNFSDTLPTGITFTKSNYTSFGQYVAIYCYAPVVCGNLQVTTDDETNFDEEVVVTMIGYNGVQAPQTQSWNDISINPLNNNQNVRQLTDTGWLIGVATVASTMTMVPGTYMRFSIEVAQINDVKDFRATMYTGGR